MKYISKSKSDDLDKILTHNFWGLLLFLFLMWLMFYCTFTLGAYPQHLIGVGTTYLSDFVVSHMDAGELRDLLVDGVVGGLGSVIVFLPNILILFLFIALFEETGYMSRANVIMGKYMQKIGLHSQSFVPMIMGFGCNVPAIMSTNLISNPQYRLLTILVNPFMSCSARLPIYILLIGAFFPKHPVTVLIIVYSIGIITAILMTLILRKFIIPVSSSKTKVNITLLPYSIPSFKKISLFIVEKAGQYLKKIGGIVLLAVIIIWALNYYPRNVNYSKDYDNLALEIEKEYENLDNTGYSMEEKLTALELERKSEHQEKSYLGRIGHFVEPAMRPLGFDWKMSVALLSGLSAKEFVVSTLGVIYQVENSDENSVTLMRRLRNEVYTSGPKIGQKTFNSAVALSFLVFVLLYFPCVTSIATIRKETGSWYWASFCVFYTTATAWIMAFFVYRLSLLFL